MWSQRFVAMRSCGALLGLAALLGLQSQGQAQQKQPAAPQSLPDKIVKAWTAADAKVGWLRAQKSGFLEFVSDKESKPGDVPAFRISPWREGVIAKLPDAGVA